MDVQRIAQNVLHQAFVQHALEALDFTNLNVGSNVPKEHTFQAENVSVKYFSGL